MLNKNNKDLISVKYIIDENKDENFFVANIDLENISAITSEKEVLFLPLSCFEIYSIEEKEDYSIIRLKYLTEYKLEMLKYIEELKAQNKIQFFFEKIAESKYSKDIAEIIGPQAQEKIDFFIKKKDINMIKQAILSISSAFFYFKFLYRRNKVCYCLYYTNVCPFFSLLFSIYSFIITYYLWYRICKLCRI